MQTCRVEGCTKKLGKGADGLCGMHYLRLTRYGRLHAIVNRGSGCSVNAAGYVVIWVEDRWQYEHVLVAERALGKPLPKGAVVHHIDGKPYNNAASNLIVCPSQSYHLLLHKRAEACE